MAGDDEKDQYSERPANSDFQQQNLKAWQPLLTPAWVIGTFALIGIAFIPIGVVILQASDSVVTQKIQYTDQKGDDTLTFTIENDMGAEDGSQNIYFYYRLTDFYQNHRRYVKSRSDEQLRGADNPSTSTCDPLEKWPEDDKVIYPCGLIANSYFNDTFSNFKLDGVDLGDKVTQEGIAWQSDVDKKFAVGTSAAYSESEVTRIGPGGYVLPNVTDEAFIVWMRTAGLPDFMKLRYIIKGTQFKKGQNLSIAVNSVFDTKSFGGEKWIVISTTSWLGGKNEFLGYAYIVVGALCILFGLGFWIKHCVSPRKLGDMQYANFNWASNHR